MDAAVALYRVRRAGCRFRGERGGAIIGGDGGAPFSFYGQCVGSIGGGQRLFPFFDLIGQPLESGSQALLSRCTPAYIWRGKHLFGEPLCRLSKWAFLAPILPTHLERCASG